MARYLESAPDHDLAQALWGRLAERPVLYRLIEDEEPDWDVIDHLSARGELPYGVSAGAWKRGRQPERKRLLRLQTTRWSPAS